MPRRVCHLATISLFTACVAIGWGHQPTEPQPAPEPQPPVPAPLPAPPESGETDDRDPVQDLEPLEAPPEAVVLLRTGRQMVGLLTADEPESVTLRVGGLEQRFARGDVLRVTILPDVLDRYRVMRAAIDSENVDELLLLVSWLQERERFRLALRETENILSIDPGNAQARSKRVLLEQQIALRERAGAETREPARPVERETDLGPGPVRASVPLLTDEQVNLLKVFELNLADPGRLIIPREVIDEILDRYRGQPGVPLTRDGQRALYAKRPAEIAALLFELRARELYGQIEVRDHPPAMEIFRDHVHKTWLQNSCASNRCHGGTDAGRFWLATRRPNAERTIYTNFLILDRYRIIAPENPAGVPLLDYENPARSPLLQMALPADLSLFPHPPLVGRDAKRLRPIFRSMDDRQFRRAASWIDGMHKPRPTYPIEYEPPRPPGAMPGEIRSIPGER